MITRRWGYLLCVAETRLSVEEKNQMGTCLPVVAGHHPPGAEVVATGNAWRSQVKHVYKVI